MPVCIVKRIELNNFRRSYLQPCDDDQLCCQFPLKRKQPVVDKKYEKKRTYNTFFSSFSLPRKKKGKRFHRLLH